MRPHGILMVLLVCLVVVNSTEMDKTEKGYSYKDIPGMIATQVKGFWSGFKNTVDELNNRPGTKQICVWKICSFQGPINKKEPEVVTTDSWWNKMFKKTMDNELITMKAKGKEELTQEWLKNFSILLRKKIKKAMRKTTE